MTVSLVLDTVKEKLGIHTDAELCHALDISPPVLSKLRSGTVIMGPAYLIRLHEASDIGTLELKKLLASRRSRT